MQIPVSFHTTLKTAELLAFLDSGATKCFVSQRFIDKHKLSTHLMTIPRKLQNADGSSNAGGGLTHFTKLEVFTGDVPHVLRFYIADMGPDDLVLGYPWFAATNAQPDWATGTLPASVNIHTKGAASGKPMRSVQVAGMRTTIQNLPLLDKGDELYLRLVRRD
jgi:gag-polyprotein putative aspartyl protease